MGIGRRTAPASDYAGQVEQAIGIVGGRQGTNDGTGEAQRNPSGTLAQGEDEAALSGWKRYEQKPDLLQIEGPAL